MAGIIHSSLGNETGNDHNGIHSTGEGVAWEGDHVGPDAGGPRLPELPARARNGRRELVLEGGPRHLEEPTVPQVLRVQHHIRFLRG